MSRTILDEIVDEFDQQRPSSRFSGWTPGQSVVDSVRRNRDILQSAVDITREKAQTENRSLHRSEQDSIGKADERLGLLDERITELETLEHRTAIANKARVEEGVPREQRTGPGVGGAVHTGGGETYYRSPRSPSFFRDLATAKRGDADAADRLRRNNVENGQQTRALGNTGGTGGSGGEFAPPAFLVEDFVAIARSGSVTPNLFAQEDLPAGVSSVNIPKVQTGTSVAPQTTQNTLLSQTDITTTQVSSTITTLGGKIVVSRQLLDQSPGDVFDRMIMADLAADHARSLGVQALTGTGIGGNLRGYLTPASTSVVTWTTATPTASGMYGKLAQLQGQINATRFKSPDTVVCHPRRWAWLASYVDSTGRPLIVPTAGGFNALANPDATQGYGHVGSILGMEVYTDANIPTNLGAGANQDVVLVFPRTDIVHWGSPPQAETFDSPYSDSMSILYRIYSYHALIPDRYLASLGQVSGTGLTPPVFAN